ncbi:hypothetical protein JCM21900_006499 [Sporobolomyces salmonicolor]
MTAVLQEIQQRLQDPSIPWRQTVLAVVLGVTAFEGWIGSRQKPYLSPILHPSLPAALRPYLTSPNIRETYTKSQAYARHKLDFSSVINTLDLAETGILLTGISAPLLAKLGYHVGGKDWTLLKGFWDAAGQVPGAGGSEIRQSMAFVALMTVIGQVLSIPKELYKHFVMEEKHGFNKMTKGTFTGDQIKGLFLSLVLEVPLIAGLLSIIEWAGQDAILRIVAYAIGFIFLVQLIMIPLFPYVIAPMFNKFTPLPEDSPALARVKGLAERLHFPLGKVWVINGSLRSSHSNAYFYGLPGLEKQIVIFDTLLEKSSPEEVEAILAHELGHWRGHHIVFLLATSLLQSAFSLTIFTLFLSNGPLLQSFGFHPSLSSKLLHPLTGVQTGPTIITLFLASTLFAPLSAFLHFLTNTVTRALEYDADAFAVKLGSDMARNLKKALVGLHEKNLAIYGVDHIYSAYNHNHPTLVERLEALDAELDKKSEKKEQ